MKSMRKRVVGGIGSGIVKIEIRSVRGDESSSRVGMGRGSRMSGSGRNGSCRN
jgi:hypothetical protein